VAAAAVSQSDDAYKRQSADVTAVYAAERAKWDEQAAAALQEIADIRRTNPPLGDAQLQAALTRLAEIRRAQDQLYVSEAELPLRRANAVKLVSRATNPTEPAPPRPIHMALGALVVGLALGLELGLLVTRRMA
jgi:uncharacterized protein involved in exopolysaccharide biosynthesis